jgi:hypothetical protein
MTPQHPEREVEREASAKRALAELQDLSENWSLETSLAQMSKTVAAAPDHKRAGAIEALCRLAFEEGFYRAAVSFSDHLSQGSE